MGNGSSQLMIGVVWNKPLMGCDIVQGLGSGIILKIQRCIVKIIVSNLPFTSSDCWPGLYIARHSLHKFLKGNKVA